MIPIVVLLAGAIALLLYTIAEEIRRERAFRRRNLAWMATSGTSPLGRHAPARAHRTTNRRSASLTTPGPGSRARRVAEREFGPT